MIKFIIGFMLGGMFGTLTLAVLVAGREWTINHLNQRRRREGVYQEFVIAKIEGPQSRQR